VAHEVRPGTFTRLFTEVGMVAETGTREALGAAAAAVERAAKENLARAGTHKRGTKTPASPGGPPALVSGTLRRSVTHTLVTRVNVGIWETKVGTGVGVFPPYGKNRTASSQYGAALETGLRNGVRYPWLEPAFRQVMPQVRGISMDFFRRWPRL
jgi:hypothetical protein